MKRWSWSSFSARMGAFPYFLWSRESSLPGTWVLVLANIQSTVLPPRLPIDVVGGRGCVGVAWYFCAAGGALVWAPFAACLFSGLFFCLHQVFMKGWSALT